MTKSSPIAEFFDRSFRDASYPRIQYCPDQSSLCMFGPIDAGGMIHWRPVRRAVNESPDVIDRLPSLAHNGIAKEFVSGYWSSTLDCWYGYEPFTLDCGAWNEAAYRDKQLQLQLHFAAQEGRGLPFSLPLGESASGSECRYTMRLDNGEVWMVEPDGLPYERQAESLASFFAELRYEAVSEDLLDRVFE